MFNHINGINPQDIQQAKTRIHELEGGQTDLAESVQYLLDRVTEFNVETSLAVDFKSPAILHLVNNDTSNTETVTFTSKKGSTTVDSFTVSIPAKYIFLCYIDPTNKKFRYSTTTVDLTTFITGEEFTVTKTADVVAYIEH